MCRAFQPFTMQGIYFSLKTSFQIKISPFHLSLLQSHHIPREKNLASLKNHFFLFYYIIEKPEKVIFNDNVNHFFLFHQEREEILFFRFEEPVFLLSRDWYSRKGKRC